MIIILSAPSGGGKTSISKRILEDKKIKLSISATTRHPRHNEQEGIDYYFKTVKEFEKLKRTDALLEYAKVYDNFYGTPKQHVYHMLQEGYDVLFDIDHQGAQQIKHKLPSKVLSIFIMPPSIIQLKQRLKDRGNNSNYEIERRINMAREVMSHADEYDYTVTNDNFEQAVKEIQGIIKKERKKR